MSNLSKEQITTVVNLFNNGQVQEALIALKSLNNEYPNVPLIFICMYFFIIHILTNFTEEVMKH